MIAFTAMIGMVRGGRRIDGHATDRVLDAGRRFRAAVAAAAAATAVLAALARSRAVARAATAAAMLRAKLLCTAAAACSNNIMIRTDHRINEKVGESQSAMLILSLMSHRRRRPGPS